MKYILQQYAISVLCLRIYILLVLQTNHRYYFARLIYAFFPMRIDPNQRINHKHLHHHRNRRITPQVCEHSLLVNYTRFYDFNRRAHLPRSSHGDGIDKHAACFIAPSVIAPRSTAAWRISAKHASAVENYRKTYGSVQQRQSGGICDLHVQSTN